MNHQTQHAVRTLRGSGRRLVAALIAATCLLGQYACAAELIVVDQPDCPYCHRFDAEIAVAWPKTDNGKRAPLRRVGLLDDWPKDLSAVEPATLTPTFILVEDGQEVDRLVGYPGDEHFWFLIGQLLDQLETAPEG